MNEFVLQGTATRTREGSSAGTSGDVSSSGRRYLRLQDLHDRGFRTP